jgi:hypothetical protein
MKFGTIKATTVLLSLVEPIGDHEYREPGYGRLTLPKVAPRITQSYFVVTFLAAIRGKVKPSHGPLYT